MNKISDKIIQLATKTNSKTFYCPYCARLTISPTNIKQGIAMCAMCTSFERQRFLYYVYHDEFLNTDKKINLLHFAPENSIYQLIKKNVNINYTYCDLTPENFPFAENIRREDGMSLSFDDKTFDVIIHNHILEHMPNDIDFIKETLRVLKDDGKIIVSIPYSKDSLCDDTKISDEDRAKFYGQSDHLRMYGNDILNKIVIDDIEIKIIYQNDYLSEIELESIKGNQDISGDLYMIIKKLK